jgi:hypothetical protein
LILIIKSTYKVDGKLVILALEEYHEQMKEEASSGRSGDG